MAELKTKAETLIGKGLIMAPMMKGLNWWKELITLLSQIAIVEYVDGLSDNLNREPQDARFEFSDGKVRSLRRERQGGG